MNPAQAPASPPPGAALIVVMGVTGSGKSTVGAALGQRLRVPFADADDFHSEANIAKMSDGIPLDDEDRLPWLRAIGTWLSEHAATGGVASCSALKRSYRDILREAAPTVSFVHLHGEMDAVRRRVAGRPGHFMPTSLVESQFKTLEPLEPDEQGIVLDFSASVDELVDAYLAATAQTTSAPGTGSNPSPADSATPAASRNPERDDEAGSPR
ncbi:gluconokinase [Streptosporangium sp. NPDC050280]|uniref:gluconokinase n=1 Tax=unclassified Streptosporangium TaxID=2632669 RepID=UPI0034174BCB